MKVRRAGIAAALTLVVALGGAQAAGAAVSDSFYGVNVQYLFDSSSSSTWSPQLAAVSGAGISLAREDARWQNVEPRAPSGGHHSYNWSLYDSFVTVMAQNHVRWYPIVDYSTSWSGVISGDSNSMVAPSHYGDFATYANVFAQRYGRGGSFWKAHPNLPQLPVTTYEIWNEENSTAFLRPQSNAPEAYADLYMAARAAIKPVDPQARVVVGGLALGNNGGADEIQFIQRMFAHRPDLKGNVDAVGLHPYQLAVADVYRRIALFRAALDKLAGPSVPIELTELGWSTTAVSDAQRAANLATLANQLPRSDCNISRLIVYSWTSGEQSSSRADDWFGIYNHNATPKSSGNAFVGTVRTMRGLSTAAAPSGAVKICHPGSTPADQSGPPLVRLHTALGRGHSRLRVVARCPNGCSFALVLLAPRPGAPVRVAHRHARFSSKRRTFRFRITHKLRRRHPVVQLQVVALSRGGAQTTSTRSIRIR